ncbi:MAG: transposase [Fibrobacterales bacterium]
MSKSYSDQFKKDAINLVREKDYSVKEKCDRLGVSNPTIYKWLNGQRIHKKTTNINSLEDENARLRKE